MSREPELIVKPINNFNSRANALYRQFLEKIGLDSRSAFLIFSMLLITLLAVIIQKSGLIFNLYSRATAPSSLAIEAETSSLSSKAVLGCDTSASGGKYIELNSSASPCSTVTPSTAISPSPQSQPTPTLTPNSLSYQPSAPYYATFYYPWYQNPDTDGLWSDWNDPGAAGQAHQPAQNWFSNYLPLINPDPTNSAPGSYDPENGLYSSQDPNVILWQLRKMAESNISVAIASWWGQGHKTDVAFGKILNSVMPRLDNPYPNLRWAIYYEKQGFNNLSLSEITNDLNYIKTHYTSSPYYLKIGGKPVIFVYDAAHAGGSPLADLAVWKQARASTGFYINMKRDALSAGAASSDMDSWHEYAPANREGQVGNSAYYVSPGFWKDGDTVRLCRNLNGPTGTSCGSDHLGSAVASFSDAVGRLVAAPVTWKLVETWNEWGEGTSVEPGTQVIQTTTGSAAPDTSPLVPPFGNAYIDVLHQKLPPLSSGAGFALVGQPNSPTPTPPPTPTPTPVGITVGGGTGSGDPVILAAGDMVCGAASGSASCKQMDTANLIVKSINSSPVKAVLALGDTQYEAGGLSDYQKFYASSWGQFYNLTFPAIGNHEYGTKGGTGFFTYFNGRPVNQGKGYYDFKVGSWWIYALNSICGQVGGCQSGSPQETWFKNELAAHSGDGSCQLMYMHYPYLSSDTRNFSFYNDLDQIWRDFYAAGGEADFVGHSHFYERFTPMKVIGVNGTPAAAADPSRGIEEFIVGTGGRNTYGFGTPAANSVLRIGGVFGVMKLILHQNSADWQFISSSNGKSTGDSTTGVIAVSPDQVLDSGTITCH